MPIIYENDNDRHRLLRTSENEAVDLSTGERFKIERVDPQLSTAWGLVLGLVLGLIMVLALTDKFTTSSPEMAPPSATPIQPNIELYPPTY